MGNCALQRRATFIHVIYLIYWKKVDSYVERTKAMAAIVKQTVQRDADSVTHAVSVKEDQTTTSIRFLYYILGIVEILLAFRFLFKLGGANSQSPFVAFIYGLTSPLTLPFEGIFGRVAPATGSVIEPSTLVAMGVYAVVGWALATLVLILSRKPDEEM